MTGRQRGCGLAACAVESKVLLPQSAAVQVEGAEVAAGLIRVTARARDGVAVACPGCGRSSDREHGRYVRHVADEAVGGRPAVIDELTLRGIRQPVAGCLR